MPSSPRAPAGHPQPFAWSVETWFGPLLGCTLWMLVLAGVAWARDDLAGGVVFSAFAVAAGLGVFLWTRRRTVAAHTALQVQLGVTFVLALGAVAFVDRRLDVDSFEGAFGTLQLYGVLVLYPVLMWVFWMRERRARREH